MQDLKRVGLTTAIGTLLISGCYYTGYTQANKAHDENIFKSNAAQDITESILKGTKVDAVINSIQSKTQLVLVEQNGIYTQKLHTEDSTWNRWLTSSDIEISLETRASVGIDVKDIMFYNAGDKLIVQCTSDSFQVISLEVTNENILLNRKFLGKNFTDNEKIAIKKHIVATAKEKVVSDEKVLKEAEEAFGNYIEQLSSSFDIDVEIIVVK